ncbi:DMT family transporter [uncultured Castellaniella sp.]|uniref:DMT family transporter n=1 Tax=uncultured Castellaniella sp. TaxID=647907 RepID=UPI0026029A8C|nr:DMT family transporter [uncultured Castellaniella sp.]
MPNKFLRNGTGPAALLTVYFLIVVVSWGINYPLTKLALRDIAPLSFSALRLLGGALFVAIILWASRAGKMLPPRHERARLAAISVMQFVSVVGFSGIALLFLPAGRTVAAIYSMPLWAAVLDALIMKVRLSRIQYAGISVSLCGIVLFLQPSVIDWNAPGTTTGTLLVLTAAMLWGLGAVLYRGRPLSASLLSQTLWQLLASGIVLALGAVIFERPLAIDLTLQLALILLWNWIVPTAAAVWAWSQILYKIPASIAGQFLMATPFVGIAASAIIFDEQLSSAFTSSAILIVAGGTLTLMTARSTKP